VQHHEKRAKYHFEKKLAENIKKGTKSFYAYVKGKAKTARNIGSLTNEYGEVVKHDVFLVPTICIILLFSPKIIHSFLSNFFNPSSLSWC